MVADPVARIVAALEAKPAGGGWKAHCPVHDDGTESISIGKGRDGRALVKCHAGCATEDVVAAVGLTVSDLYVPDPTRTNGNGNGRYSPIVAPKPTASRPALVKTYDYVDESGALLYQACRFEPGKNGRKKDFRQRRPDGKGDWIWSLKQDDGTSAVAHVPYRLPELIEAVAAERPVYVVEGEKDADALWAEGYAATTNVGGADKWKDEYTAHLSGASVVVLPDNDDAGAKHGHAVANSCYAQGIPVRVVALPGLPAKGDVSDWFAAGHTLDELDALVSAAPRWMPEAERDKPRTSWRLDELWENESIMRPPAAVVPRLAWEARSTLLAAAEKSGKSTLTGFIAAQVSRGGYFLDGTCADGVVLIVGLEEFIGDAARRLRQFGADGARVHLADHLPGDPRERPQALRALIEELAPRLVIVDTLIAYSSGAVSDASASAQMGPIVEEVTRIAHDTGASIVLVHHARKSDGRYRDSSAIGGAVDVIVEMFAPHEDTDPTLRQFRSRGRVPVTGFLARFEGDTYRLDDGQEAPLEQRILTVVRSRPNLSVNDVADAVVGQRAKTLAAIQLMLADGRVYDNSHGHTASKKLCARADYQPALGGG